MKVKKRWAVMAVATAVAFVLGASSMVVAGVVFTGQANDLAVIKVVNDDTEQTTTSADWVNLAGAVRRATSTGTDNLFVAEFDALGACVIEADCFVRIVVKDLAGSIQAVMTPDAGGGTEMPVDEFEPLALTRSIKGLAAASYDFQVQFKSNGTDSFSLEFWHLTLQRYT